VKKLVVVLTLISILGLVVAACAPAATPCPPCPEGGECPPAPECPEAPDCPDCPPVGPTTDLGGREVRIAVEDAYPPFNYIDADTNESVMCSTPPASAWIWHRWPR